MQPILCKLRVTQAVEVGRVEDWQNEVVQS